ncbi:MAG: ATP-binding protein [Eubacteriaceae bacterium]|nr:ATP-binding protein [Eubacteriaceae bacterium]
MFSVQRFTQDQTETRLQEKAELMAQTISCDANDQKRALNEKDLNTLFPQSRLKGSTVISSSDLEDTGQAQKIYKNKKDYVAGVAEITGSKYMDGWYVVCEETYSAAYKDVNTLATVIIVLIVAAFLILWILGKRLSFNIQRPIKQLSVEASQIVDGDISHGLSVSENNELKVIADSFNNMLDHLKDTMQQVLDKSGEAASMHEIMEYVEQTYDELPGGILSINNVGEIITFNETAEALTGLDAKNVVGLDIKNPTPLELKNLIQPMNRCLSRGSLQLKTLGDIKNTAGDKIPIEYSINIQFGLKNEVLGAICLFRSISDLERFEASAQRSKNLNALGEMAASLAHEIKNPLASIRGYTQFVRQDMESENMETEEMDIIMNEVDKLTVMLDKFLKFARPEVPETENENIGELIEYVLKLMEKDIPDNIRVVKHLDPVPKVAIDKSQFEPLLLNLFLNGIQAMPDGGTLMVRTVYEGWRNMVRIDIQDSGVGIPQELSDKIFTPFFTTKEGGTGLGLPICSRTVEAHKGVMEVESIEGEMTKFTILLQGRSTEGEETK